MSHQQIKQFCVWLPCVASPEDVRPAVVVVAAHLQPHVQDGVHAQHVGRVEAHGRLRPGHLLQALLDCTGGSGDSTAQ